MKTSLLIAGSLALVPMTYAQDKPNIIIILADDLGFSDLGCFGGEIHTPVLDKLAKNGVRMTQMYNSARSCPSRANLLTGLYPHQTGLGHMDGSHPALLKGYSGFRSNSDNVTIAEVLKDAGYFTAMSGKWHLGNKSNPILRGFQEYYGLLGGFNSFWNPAVYTRLPKDRTPRHYEEGTFYATNVITDYAIDFIDQAHQEKKPLFLYLAYNAPHFPLHAPKEVTDKYMSLYMQGWDKIRDARWKRIVDLKLMQGKPALSPRGVVPESLFEDETHPLPAWDSLTKDQQTDLARRMSIFAAMVDVMDANIYRVVDELKKTVSWTIRLSCLCPITELVPNGTNLASTNRPESNTIPIPEKNSTRWVCPEPIIITVQAGQMFAARRSRSINIMHTKEVFPRRVLFPGVIM